MSKEIAASCNCRLCGKSLVGPVALVVGAGLDYNNARVAQFTMKLAEHIITEHPDENKALEYKALEFLGMLRLANFETKDAGIIEQRDFLRWRTNQATIGDTLSDESIDGLAKKLSGDVVDMCEASLIILGPGQPPPSHIELVRPQLKAQVTALLVELLADAREKLQEPGRYKIDETPAGDGKSKVVLN